MRILFLAPFPPGHQAPNGGARVMAQLLSGLAQRHAVGLLYLQSPGEPSLEANLAGCCSWVEAVERADWDAGGSQEHQRRVFTGLAHGRPVWVTDLHSPEFTRRVRELAAVWQPEVVQVEFGVMGQYLWALKDCPAPRVLTLHEPGAATARQRMAGQAGPGRILRLLNWLAWERYERAIALQAHALVAFTRRDARSLESIAGRTPVRCIPFGVPLRDRPLDACGSEPTSLLFFGNYGHPPNVEAALRLMRQIYPALRRRRPGLQLVIAGQSPTAEMQAAAGEGVRLTGWVPDLTPYLEQAAVVVAPLRSGGGMRVKVAEALAAGKAVVASPLAVEGLEVRHGEQVCLAEEDRQFIAEIENLLEHPEQRAALGARAFAWARQHLPAETFSAGYEALYQELCEVKR